MNILQATLCWLFLYFSHVHGEGLTKYEQMVLLTKQPKLQSNVAEKYELPLVSLIEGSAMFKEWFSEGGSIMKKAAKENVSFLDKLDAVVPPSDDSRTASNLMDTVRLLLSIVRHWSDVGADLRAETYERIFSSFETVYGNKYRDLELRILVPGAGMCRLAYELAQQSSLWHVEAIEQHEADLRVVVFLLNVLFEEPFAVYPSLHITNGWSDGNDRFTSYTIPDVDPKTLGEANDFDLVQGDFPQYYFEAIEGGSFEGFDAVVTSFFLDAIHPLVVISSIARILLLTNSDRCMNGEGGEHPLVWINSGPLVYPRYDNEASIELPFDMILHAVEKAGFLMIEQSTYQCNYEGLPAQGEERVLTCFHFAAELAIGGTCASSL